MEPLDQELEESELELPAEPMLLNVGRLTRPCTAPCAV